jgi:hypothetical protein
MRTAPRAWAAQPGPVPRLSRPDRSPPAAGPSDGPPSVSAPARAAAELSRFREPLPVGFGLRVFCVAQSLPRLLEGAECLQMSQVANGASGWSGALGSKSKSKSNRVPTDPDPDPDSDFDVVAAMSTTRRSEALPRWSAWRRRVLEDQGPIVRPRAEPCVAPWPRRQGCPMIHSPEPAARARVGAPSQPYEPADR